MSTRARAVLAVFLGGTACSGPGARLLPGEVAAPPARGSLPEPPAPFLRDFTGEVRAALEAAPGTVAVFPALTFSAEQRPFVNELGTFLMREVARGLEDLPEAAVWSDAELLRELEAAGRGPEFLCAEHNALQLAERIEADYVVAGTVQFDNPAPLARPGVLVLRLACYRARDPAVVAQLHTDLVEGDLYRAWVQRCRRPHDGPWRPCRPHDVDLAFEIEFLCRRSLRHLTRRAGFAEPLRVEVRPPALPHSSLRRILEQSLARALEAEPLCTAAEAEPEGALEAAVRFEEGSSPVLQVTLSRFQPLAQWSESQPLERMLEEPLRKALGPSHP